MILIHFFDEREKLIRSKVESFEEQAASVTRLGDFWKILVTNLLIKVAQMFCNIWGYFEVWLFNLKIAVTTFLGSSLRIQATFCSNNWSHCLQQQQQQLTHLVASNKEHKVWIRNKISAPLWKILFKFTPEKLVQVSTESWYTLCVAHLLLLVRTDRLPLKFGVLNIVIIFIARSVTKQFWTGPMDTVSACKWRINLNMEICLLFVKKIAMVDSFLTWQTFSVYSRPLFCIFAFSFELIENKWPLHIANDRTQTLSSTVGSDHCTTASAEVYHRFKQFLLIFQASV